jgi:hypothetical protein
MKTGASRAALFIISVLDLGVCSGALGGPPLPPKVRQAIPAGKPFVMACESFVTVSGKVYNPALAQFANIANHNQQQRAVLQSPQGTTAEGLMMKDLQRLSCAAPCHQAFGPVGVAYSTAPVPGVMVSRTKYCVKGPGGLLNEPTAAHRKQIAVVYTPIETTIPAKGPGG